MNGNKIQTQLQHCYVDNDDILHEITTMNRPSWVVGPTIEGSHDIPQQI